MIGKLKGTVDDIKPTEMILDVNGVGYELAIPFSTYEKIQNEKLVTLYIHTIHKEEHFRLFGFYTKIEKDIFKSLINISGIGPAIAISILSGITPDRLIDAIRSQNPLLLTKIPGIGKAKAEKLVFELKRKLRSLEKIAGYTHGAHSKTSDAVDALVVLGFDEKLSTKCVNDIVNEKGDIGIEEIIKSALKMIS
ncbi:MAG: Holliday junction branch migration protein RuvA [Leptospirales bacterium]|nr:Holliday junction branch migration protein RuvA [Leptospirales bacterium]